MSHTAIDVRGIGFFLLGTAAYMAMGYWYGRRLLPRAIVFPIAAWRVGRFIMTGFTSFLLVRTAINMLVHPEFVNIDLLLESYADITAVSLAVMYGYSSASMRSPRSIKSGLAFHDDGGVLLVDPFTSAEEENLREGSAPP